MDAKTICVRFAVLVCLLSATAESHKTACNQDNATLCLEGSDLYPGVRAHLKNTARYWFGDVYDTDCPEAEGRRTMTCFNPAPSFRCIITRMRWAQNSETQSVTQTLNITYSAPSGFYKACGSQHEVEATNKTIDHVHSVKTDSWVLNHRPSVTWQAQAGEKYTLVFWDAGHFQLHGMWVNIGGGSLEDGDEVIPYNGPMNPFPRHNAYVFGLCVQTGDVSVTTAFDYVMHLRRTDGHVRISKIMNEFNLNGPFGIGIIRTKVDAFSGGSGCPGDHGINYCPYVQTTAIKDDDSDFPLNVTDVELTVSVDVRYIVPAMTFESCCNKHEIMNTTVRADTLYKTHISPVLTTSRPRVRLIQTYVKDEPYYFLHRKFTLLLVDMTDLIANDTARPNTILHWQVINIRDPLVRTGETTVDYLGAIASPPPAHKKYIFLLLEQSGTLSRQQVQGFVGSNCSPQIWAGRCWFDVVRFMKDLNLKLAGFSGFEADTDPWSRKQSYERLGTSKAVACLGVADYSDPCPDRTGVASLPSLGWTTFAFSLLSALLSSF